MKLKKYCIYGFIERYVTARLGKGTISFHFEGGALDSSAVLPATYSTKNPVEQAILENHPDFKNGTIKLKEVLVIEEPKKVEEKKVTVDSVTTFTEAKKYLLENGATVEELQNKAAVYEWAAAHDIVFPNWK